jgi:stage II sporulation protein D
MMNMQMLPFKRVVLICLIVCLFPQYLCAETVASAFLRRADDCYSAGRYLEALSLYRDCLNNSDTAEQKASALFGLGLLFDRYLDDPEQALAYYKSHIELQGADSDRALHYSAQILVRQSRRDDARGYYHKVLQGYTAYSAANGVQREFDNCMTGAGKNFGLFDRKRLECVSGIVRVLIENSSEPVVIKGKSGLRIAPHGREELFEHCDDMLVLQADNNTLLVNKMPWAHEALMVQGEVKDSLEVNSRRYRSLVSVRAVKGRLQVINHVPLDHYLYGVLPREVYVSWPMAALQAQAVAARTYVLYHMLVRQDRSYDVLSTTSSQVYGGLDREHPETNRAVDTTRSQVLFNGSQLALTLYHANSGGVVEPIDDVWGARLPHLRRVVDTPSLQGRHVRWSCSLSVAEVIDHLAGYGVQCRDLETIEVVNRSASGRVQHVMLKGQGTSVLVGGNNLRLMLGPSVVKSTRFIVEQSEGLFRFTGTGYGHGVGMSQWGAYVLAKKGADYKIILAHYYPGTKLTQWTAHDQKCSEPSR